MHSYIIFRKIVPNLKRKIIPHIKLKSYLRRTYLINSTRYKSMDSSQFEVLPPPIKSESDKKEYKVIKLKNELVACLISDKAAIPKEEIEAGETDEESETSLSYSSDSESSDSDASRVSSNLEEKKSNIIDQKMAAAALCIGVGSFSDPKEIPGMAHFLEHMVFMGSEKFPAENDFDSFIKKSGGNDNASTDTETTCFYFECLEKHLQVALDKFSQFFISPLMKKNAMTRERESIESEFQMALPSDSSRKEQLLCQLAKPETPVNSFGWGNLKTLRDDISDEKLYEGVHAFRKRHYSAHRMTLAIQARLPLDTLQKFVVESFSQVPNNKLSKDDFSAFSDVFNTPDFTRLYYIKPIKQMIKLDLNWSLPSLQHKYKSKPLHYVSFLIGDEGRGSLLSYLKKRMWAISIQAGNEETGSDHNSMFALFNISVGLTEEGQKHVFEIIEAVFSYINLLKKVGPQRRIYDEIKLIIDTSFRFATESSPVDNVESLCESMQIYPSADYITGSEIFYEFDPKAITTVMDSLVPKKVNVMVTTKDLPDGLKFDKTEKWFSTEYTDLPIPEDVITKWETVEPYPELNVPPINPYLTNNFAILPETNKHPEYPQKLIDTAKCELWFRRDQTYKLPMAYYYFCLVSPTAVESARSLTLSEMFLNLLSFAIAEEAYPANTANIGHQFSMGEKGIEFKVSGFNEKIPTLIEVITKYIKNLQDFIDERMFEVIKETLLKSYCNKILKPSTLAKDTRLKVLLVNYWTPVDRYNELSKLTFEDVVIFMNEYRKKLYIKSLVQGNVSEDVALNTVKNFVETLEIEELPKEHYPSFVIAQIPLGQKCLLVESFNKNDTNSITSNYYQVGPYNIRDSVIIDIMMMIIEEPLFDVLRTKEQLGYHVYCTSRDTYGILGFSLTVNSQAVKFTTHHLDQRIEAFLKHSQKILEETSPKDFEEIKEDLIKTKELADTHLKEEVDRNWSEITNDYFMFDRIKREIEEIKVTKYQEIINWWNSYNLFGKQESCRKLSIQVIGHVPDAGVVSKGETLEAFTDKQIMVKLLDSNDVKREVAASDYIVDNIDAFRAKLELFPPRSIK
ncbi:nardilysin [Diorhabda sublineata]|uniref:nardilysin n=1 Tax=Diorhabda sublineata TaxID=1163346 RepID=UPI0024E12B59|nr:nardilysin [Diorhabda sublineata]